MTKTLTLKRCTFCCKTQGQVEVLIDGPEALICNECIALCVEIVFQRGSPKARETVAAAINQALETVSAMVEEDEPALPPAA